MSKKMESLDDLFEHQLQDLYSAETQIIEALPEMAKKASAKALKDAFRDHLKETKEQKERLEQVCEDLGISPKGEKCKAMAGIIKEAQSFMEEDASKEVMDAGLIAHAQSVEHYEIAGYGTACHYAKKLGKKDAEKLLKQTLKEEKNADSLLNEVAMDKVNEEAV